MLRAAGCQSGLVSSESKRVAYLKHRKSAFIPSNLSVPLGTRIPDAALWDCKGQQQDWWLWMCLGLCISAAIGSSISHKPLCLHLYVPALITLKAAAHIPPPLSSPGRYSPSHVSRCFAETDPVHLAQHWLVWDEVRHWLGLHPAEAE